MLTVSVSGVAIVQTMLADAMARLATVPKRFSENESAKGELKAVAQLTMAEVGFSAPGVSKHGTSYENVTAESIPDGIAVFEKLNEDTASTHGESKGKDQYAIFALPEFNPSFLKDKRKKDFFKFWKPIMRPIAERHVAQEVREALKP
jgi:hypothetical protein